MRDVFEPDHDERKHSVLFDEAATETLMSGLKEVADAVCVTMGPKGQLVVIEDAKGIPLVTKDGVTVARSIRFRDRGKNLGASILRRAALYTNEEAGDGTTTSTCIARSLCEEGIRASLAGVDPVELRESIDHVATEILKELDGLAVPIKDEKSGLFNIATISANGDEEIGQLLSEAYEAVGSEGVVAIDQSRSTSTNLEIVDGLVFERGYCSPYFVTDERKMEVTLENVAVLVADKRVTAGSELVPVLEQLVKEGRSLLIIATGIEGEALQTLVVNSSRGMLKSCAVVAPFAGRARSDALMDIAACTGGQVITGPLLEYPFDDLVTMLGKCEKAVITRTTTTIVGGKVDKERIESRLAELNELDGDIRIKTSRKAMLEGKVAFLRIGGQTDMELRERLDRVEDANNAVKAALAEGIVPGGGLALYRSAHAVEKKLKTLNHGERAMLEACRSPMKTILKNAGINPGVVEHTLGNSAWTGYDAARGNPIESMLDAGIIDPKKVVRVALENAVSVAKLVLSTRALVIEDD